MSRESLVFIIGLCVLVTPFLGIPRDWKDLVFIVIGVLLMIVGYMLRRSAFLREIENEQGERRSDAFVEHSPLSSKILENNPMRE